MSQLGAACTLLFGLYSLLSGEHVEKILAQTSLGLGCFLQYLSVVQFFETSPRYNVLVLTPKRGFQSCSLFAGHVLFFGFMLLGMVFSETTATGLATSAAPRPRCSPWLTGT